MSTFNSPLLNNAAQQFTSLMSSRKPIAQTILRPCALRVIAGQHIGAMLRVSKPTSIGSGPNSDIVLTDTGISPGHAQLCRVDNEWVLTKGPAGALIAPFEAIASGRFVRKSYILGAAQLTVTQIGKAPKQPTGLKNKFSHKTIAIGLMVAAAMLTAAIAVQLMPSPVAKQIKTSRSLRAEGWPDVSLVVGDNTRVQAKGYVSDSDDMKRLQSWLKSNDVETGTAAVRVGADIVNRVKEALSDPTLTVFYLGAGTVRVSGSSDSAATRERLSRLKADLANVVAIEDQVAFVQVAESKPREHVLPIRITDVRPGTDSVSGSFGADNNTRYFVGGVLPDGSEVLSIKTDSIEFLLGNKKIIYPLK